MKNDDVLVKLKRLLKAYKNGELGQTNMPEDSYPVFKNKEERLIYFTLPMALNYQRDSYKLGEAALKTGNDKDTRKVFDIKWVNKDSYEELRKKLLKYKLALQPNKHIKTGKKISTTIFNNGGSISNLLNESEKDFLKLKEQIQSKYKKDFPYLSGPKIFNYGSFIIINYGGVKLSNKEFIEIAPDTHVIQSSIKLGILSKEQVEKYSREDISKLGRELLKDSEIDPIDMHSPLGFGSRNGFLFELDDDEKNNK